MGTDQARRREAILRINAGDLVAKRALLDCIATVSVPDAVEVSSLLQFLRVFVLEFFVCFDSTDSDQCGCFGCGSNSNETAFVL